MQRIGENCVAEERNVQRIGENCVAEERNPLAY